MTFGLGERGIYLYVYGVSLNVEPVSHAVEARKPASGAAGVAPGVSEGWAELAGRFLKNEPNLMFAANLRAQVLTDAEKDAHSATPFGG